MKVTDDVLAVLAESTTEGNKLVLPGGVGSLDRKLYVATNAVIEAAGGKWNRYKRGHLFEGAAAEAIEQVLLAGEVTTHQDLQFFPTPREIVEEMIGYAEIRPGARVLEPSAGRGAIVNVLAEEGMSVDAIEFHEPFAKELANAGAARTVQHSDFLEGVPDHVRYDAVVMNPPFTKQQDLAHVRHAMLFLAPGGRLVAVMSNGVMFRQDRKTLAFRELVMDRGGWFEKLPDDAFKESGTLVRTVICVIPN